MYGPVNVRADFMCGPVYARAGLCTGRFMYGLAGLYRCATWPVNAAFTAFDQCVMKDTELGKL